MAVISLSEALQRVLTVPCDRLPVETVPLAAAHGRWLAADLRTDGPWPTTDRSAMDGFAMAAGDGLPQGMALPVVGESLAGHPFAGTLPLGAAVRIMTGAVVPAGADAVIPVEQTQGYASNPVVLGAAVKRGQNVRPQGSEAPAGTLVLPAGTPIGAAEVGALAVLGRHEVQVVQRPRVAVLATGDEVVPVERAPQPHEVRESNSWALAAQVDEVGGAPQRLGIAPDEPVALRALLERGLDGASVLLTIGGVSQGSHDFVHDTLRQLGVDAVFHGIQLKPGKPTFFGRGHRGGRPVFVFGLPGNPASCFTVFDLLVRPLLLRLCGAQPKPWQTTARLRGRWKPNARLQASPVRLSVEDGQLVAELLPPQPSGNPFSLLSACAYALLPENAEPQTLTRATVVGYSVGFHPA